MGSVPIKDYKAFAEKLLILLNDTELSGQMGENNFKHLKEKGYFDTSDNLGRVKEIWRKTLDMQTP